MRVAIRASSDEVAQNASVRGSCWFDRIGPIACGIESDAEIRSDSSKLSLSDESQAYLHRHDEGVTQKIAIDGFVCWVG